MITAYRYRKTPNDWSLFSDTDAYIDTKIWLTSVGYDHLQIGARRGVPVGSPPAIRELIYLHQIPADLQMLIKLTFPTIEDVLSGRQTITMLPSLDNR